MQDLFQQPGSPASGVLSANTDRRSEGEEPDDYLYEPTERVRTAVSAILQSTSSLSEQDCNLQAFAAATLDWFDTDASGRTADGSFIPSLDAG